MIMIIIRKSTLKRFVFFITLFVISFFCGYLTADTRTEVYVADTPIIDKWNGLLIPTSKTNEHLHYILLPGTTMIEEDKRIKLDDEEFERAIGEVLKVFESDTKDNFIYQVRSRGGMLTHACLDSLKGQNELRHLDLSNNKLITDYAAKKIAQYFPRLEILNLYNTGITGKGLEHLLALTELKKLHVTQTGVTWDQANMFRGKMQSISGNEDLEITSNSMGKGGRPWLPSYNLSRRLRATYQTNVIAGKLNPDYNIEILKDPAKENKKYEDDLDKEKDGPILNEQ